LAEARDTIGALFRISCVERTQHNHVCCAPGESESWYERRRGNAIISNICETLQERCQFR